MAKETEETNAYEVVGVGSDATDADIKKAYRQRSLKTHPDRVRRPDLSSLVVLSAHVLSRSEPPS
jgi:curved DNA-binding protein CbpA